MPGRYTDIKILKEEKGPRYYRTVKYPKIDKLPTDICVKVSYGDRFDILASKYYGDASYYWIIMQANTGLPPGSIIPTPGTIIRIPSDIEDVLKKYYELNRTGT